jgi:hypothetical protein
MSHVSLEYVQATYDPNAVLIMSKSTNANVVVYSRHAAGVKPYWLNLEPDTSFPLFEDLNAVEATVFSLQWVNCRQAYFEKIGAEKLITFSEDFHTCWADVAGEQRILGKFHVEVTNSDWLNFPCVSEIVIITRHIGPDGQPITETIRA